VVCRCVRVRPTVSYPRTPLLYETHESKYRTGTAPTAQQGKGSDQKDWLTNHSKYIDTAWEPI
jgi:hypothetical protein